MKHIIIIILFSFTSLSFSQNKNQEKDKILADSISNLSKTVNEQEKKIKELSEEINSLKPIIEESKIGKGFFQTIMTAYTSIIAVLIILGSVISGYFFNRTIQAQVINKITKSERAINRAIAAQSKEFSEFKTKVENDISEGKVHDLIADYDISRSIFFVNANQKWYDQAFAWAISAMDASRKLNKNENLLTWINSSQRALEDAVKNPSTTDKAELKKHRDEINVSLQAVLDLSDEKIEKLDEIKRIAQEVQEKFNGFIWTETKSKKQYQKLLATKTILTISSAEHPLDKSMTGFASPWRIGPVA